MLSQTQDALPAVNNTVLSVTTMNEGNPGGIEFRSKIEKSLAGRGAECKHT